MDKYEYKIRSEEIKTLISKGEYADAAAIADTIDWRRVKSVMMLCTISDLYKINRRYEDARDMLLLAYDRHPGGRSIVYSLCELSVKMGEFVQAVEYYKEFVQVAPKDSGRYVLQYKLYEAQDVSLEERIAVLEELKSKDYSEKWAYELAYLYHRIGLATKCVEECDELILWFGEGKYVLKAMELKKLHEPLSAEQQARYNQMKGIGQTTEPPAEEEQAKEGPGEDLASAPTKEIPAQELDIQVKLMNVGQYDTINIQKELAQNMKELWEGSADPAQKAAAEQPAESFGEAQQGEPAETASSDTGIIDLPDEEEEEMMEPEETKVEEIFFGATGEMDATAARVMEEMKKEALQPEDREESEDSVGEAERSEEAESDEAEQDAPKEAAQMEQAAGENGRVTPMSVEMPKEFTKILGMEYDGQISMIMPEAEQVEKQITGQLRLEDVLLEWEKMKKESEQKRMEAVRQHVMEQTGAMFTEFDAAVRDGLLEKLEKGSTDTLSEPEDFPEMQDAEEEIADGEEYADSADAGEGGGTDSPALQPHDAETAGFEDSEEVEEIEEIEEIEEAEAPETVEAFSEIEDFEDFAESEEDEEAEADEEADAFAEFEEPAGPEDLSELTGFEASGEPEEAGESGEAADEDEPETPEEYAEPEQGEPVGSGEPEEAGESGEAADEDEPETPEEYAEPEAPAGQEDAGNERERGEAGEPEDAGEPQKPAGTSSHKHKVRPMSPEERQLFGSYTQSRKTREQIVYAIDNISMAAYTGNVVITGEEGMDTLTLAKNLIKEVQQTDSNLTGRIAKISGSTMNRKGVKKIFAELANGALIVLKAGELDREAAGQMCAALEQEHSGLIVILEDTGKAVNGLFKKNPGLRECFNIRIDIEALDNDTLVAYGKKYAREQEYSIDELGVLALHTRIAERQTSDHAVTISEVREILDEAIRHANRKTLGHFVDILVAKRYDDEDMIILREKDFM